VDSAWEQKKLEARKCLPQIGRGSFQRTPFVQLDWIAHPKRMSAGALHQSQVLLLLVTMQYS
jgi:hypothetical protein